MTAVEDQIPCDLTCTNRIAYWAYSHMEAAHGLTWLRGEEMIALPAEWRNYFSVLA